MKSILILLVFISLLYTYGCSDDNGPGKGNISGKVHLVYDKTTENGQRLGSVIKQDLFSGLSVSLQNIVKEIESTVVESGVYNFTDINVGEYNIVAKINNNIRASTGFTELTEGGTTEFPLILFSKTSSSPQNIDMDYPYPNPFDDIVSIEFTTALSDNIDIRVYDLLGNEKEVLASQEYAPGTYTISYDCNLEAGFYFVLVKSQDDYAYAIISKQ